MKKLIILAMIGMITTFTSCSNESVTGTNQEPLQKTVINNNAARTIDGATPDEQAIIDIVKNSSTGKISPHNTPYGDAVINCHTNWLADYGVACVSNGGYLFRVMWDLEDPWDPNNKNRIWATQRVSSCNCNM